MVKTGRSLASLNRLFIKLKNIFPAKKSAVTPQ